MEATIFASAVGFIVILAILGVHFSSSVPKIRKNQLRGRIENGAYRENGILRWDSSEEVVDPLLMARAGMPVPHRQVFAFNDAKRPKGMEVAVKPVVHWAVAEAERIVARLDTKAT